MSKPYEALSDEALHKYIEMVAENVETYEEVLQTQMNLLEQLEVEKLRREN